MSADEKEFRGAAGVLRQMHVEGRKEAGIFLLGLLAHSGEDWQKRTTIVELLTGFKTPECADFLLGDLKRLKANNSHRRYLVAIIKAVSEMPLGVAQPRLLDLATDSSLSPKMRDRVVEALERATRRW